MVEYYHERLLISDAPLNYLKSRGLYHEEVISRFRLGFADRTLGEMKVEWQEYLSVGVA